MFAGPPLKYEIGVEYVIRCHHVDFQPNRTTLGRPTPSPPENLIKSPSSLKIAGAGRLPKYEIGVEYVIRCHHIDFQANRTNLGRPTSSPPVNLIKSPSSLKIVGAPPAPDGPPPKYVLRVVYVRRYHHINI